MGAELVRGRSGFDYNPRPFPAQLFNILHLVLGPGFCLRQAISRIALGKKSSKSGANDGYLEILERLRSAAEGQIMSNKNVGNGALPPGASDLTDGELAKKASWR